MEEINIRIEVEEVALDMDIKIEKFCSRDFVWDVSDKIELFDKLEDIEQNLYIPFLCILKEELNEYYSYKKFEISRD